MTKTVLGIYENGTIRLLKKLPLSEHQKVELRLEVPENFSKATKAIIRVRNRIGRLLAESHHLSPWGS